MRASFAQFSFPRRVLQALAPGLVLVVAGCATLPPPTGEVAAAQRAVSRADAADADQYAADAIAQARSELAQAQSALASGRDDQARTFAASATADADFAHATSQAARVRQDHDQRRREVAELRQRLGVDDGAAPTPPSPFEDLPAGPVTGDAALRLQALDADSRLGGLAAYERLQARQAMDAAFNARSRDRASAAYIAGQRVAIAELAARTEATRREVDQLDRQRSDLLVEASRQDAERARQEAERLRVEAQIQAEETQRLRAAAEAESAARLDAENLIIDVGGAEAEKLRAARAREAELARQEAELMAGDKPTDGKPKAPAKTPAKSKATPRKKR